MTIEITERTIGVWCVDMNEDSDWLGSLWETDENYEMAYRFRYYVDDLTFDSKDTKHWYAAHVSKDHTTKDDVIKCMRGAVELIWREKGGKRHELMMGSGGVDEFMIEFEKLPFVSAKRISIDEEEENKR